jgi:hypothetical protein
MFEQHPDIARAMAADRQAAIRRQYRDAHDSKVARRFRRRSR